LNARSKTAVQSKLLSPKKIKQIFRMLYYYKFLAGQIPLSKGFGCDHPVHLPSAAPSGLQMLAPTTPRSDPPLSFKLELLCKPSPLHGPTSGPTKIPNSVSSELVAGAYTLVVGNGWPKYRRKTSEKSLVSHSLKPWVRRLFRQCFALRARLIIERSTRNRSKYLAVKSFLDGRCRPNFGAAR
jgi:hypothetical protein